jgi:hypothetical protein
MKIGIPEDWTLDAAQVAGPDMVGDWVAMLMHDGDEYRVLEVRKGTITSEARPGLNKDLAVEVYLMTVRGLVMEAQGVAYLPVEDEEAPLTEREQEREGDAWQKD